MSAYRKKPVVVEARRFTTDSYNEIREWLGKSFVRAAVMNGGVKAIRLRTLEGPLTARDGDWIICGVQGEFYPCKPDIFDAIYEPVDAEAGP